MYLKSISIRCGLTLYCAVLLLLSDEATSILYMEGNRGIVGQISKSMTSTYNASGMQLYTQ